MPTAVSSTQHHRSVIIVTHHDAAAPSEVERTSEDVPVENLDSKTGGAMGSPPGADLEGMDLTAALSELKRSVCGEGPSSVFQPKHRKTTNTKLTEMAEEAKRVLRTRKLGVVDDWGESTVSEARRDCALYGAGLADKVESIDPQN